MLETLDVAIGLILVFSMVSLMCSILSEWISGVFAMRGQMLWKGIDRMLGKALSDQLCGHHLMQSLGRKTWFDVLVGWMFNRSKPAYVPTETFVTALLDVVGAPAPAAGAPQGGGMPPDFASLRAAVSALPAGGLRNALLALVDTTGPGPVAGAVDTRYEAAKKNIEQWYDNAMDRVSGAYKRWSQLVLFVLGLVVAGVLGVDTVYVAKALQARPALRAATVQAAQNWVAHQPAPPSGTGTATDADLEKLRGQLTDVRDQLAGLDIPLSPWKNEPKETSFLTWLGQHLTGFLLTALAASLGAPFWFDLLSKIVNLRATKKPEPEKVGAS